MAWATGSIRLTADFVPLRLLAAVLLLVVLFRDAAWVAIVLPVLLLSSPFYDLMYGMETTLLIC